MSLFRPSTPDAQSNRLADAARRFAALLPVLALAALTGLTVIAVQRSQQTELQPAPKRHLPDYYAENFSATMLTPQGAVHYRLRAQRAVHYEDTDEIEALAPRARAFSSAQPGQPNPPPVTITAENGQINGDGDIVTLIGAVRMTRPPAAAPRGTGPLLVASERMKLLLEDDVVISDVPVVLENGPSRIAGKRMRFDNVRRELELDGAVQGTIVKR